MIGVTNNSPQQINAALIALKGEVKNEVKNEIINNIDNSVIGETYTAGDGIDITNAVISQTTDQLTFTGTQAQWEALTSAEQAKYGLVNITDDEEAGNYPLGFIYMQLYNPTLASWEKSPLQLGMKPASGCEWTEITSNFANYPYLKIGSGTNSHGHNAVHGHRVGIWNANNTNYPKRTWKDGTNNDPDGYYDMTNGLRIRSGNAQWVTNASEYTAGILDDPFGNITGGGDLAGSTSRQGNVADNTWNELHNYPEPNNSAMKIWKVVASA